MATATTATPTQSPSPTPTESPKQQAKRLATEQQQTYQQQVADLYQHPQKPLSNLNAYAEGQALQAVKANIQGVRDAGRRLVGNSTTVKTWLGPEGVSFRDGGAVVDLYVCFNLNGSHFIDQQGEVTPITPQVAQERLAIYAEAWPNSSPSDWRIGREYAAGEPCSR